MTVHTLRRDDNHGLAARVAPSPAPEGVLVVDQGDQVVDEATGVTVLAVGSLPEGDVLPVRGALTDPALGFLRPERGVNLGRPTVRNTRTKGGVGRGRASGMAYSSRTFGYAPRMAIRLREGCSAAGLAADAPALAHAIDMATPTVEAEFRRTAPDAYAAQRAAVDEQVHADWRVAGSPWTSGIVNNSAALPYHRDVGNLPGSWSAMLCVRSGIRGGLLHVPAYRTHVACSDGSLVFFCGAALLHGVTPLAARHPRSYRFTLVWYALAGMRHCLPCAEELAQAQRRRTDREAAR